MIMMLMIFLLFGSSYSAYPGSCLCSIWLNWFLWRLSLCLEAVSVHLVARCSPLLAGAANVAKLAG